MKEKVTHDLLFDGAIETAADGNHVQASCACRWRGPERESDEHALLDLAKHYDENAAVDTVMIDNVPTALLGPDRGRDRQLYYFPVEVTAGDGETAKADLACCPSCVDAGEHMNADAMFTAPTQWIVFVVDGHPHFQCASCTQSYCSGECGR